MSLESLKLREQLNLRDFSLVVAKIKTIPSYLCEVSMPIRKFRQIYGDIKRSEISTLSEKFYVYVFNHKDTKSKNSNVMILIKTEDIDKELGRITICSNKRSLINLLKVYIIEGFHEQSSP